jgi:hypothetical protein
MAGWIGVDLDGTLAHYEGWQGEGHIGPPVPAMLERIHVWLRNGVEVRIFTARVNPGEGRHTRDVAAITRIIQDWLEAECDLPRLAVTNIKDFAMIELWDDRAVSVEMNTGRIRGGA